MAHIAMEPRSKNSIRPTEKESFRLALATALHGRTGFTSPVALEMYLHATANNPPEIHTVAKNYLDLAYRAPARQGRLFGDDRQVQYLAVRYDLKQTRQPSIVLRADRMSNLRQDILLAQQIRREESGRWDDHFELDAYDDLERWENTRDATVRDYGVEVFEGTRRVLLANVQRQWLSGTERLLHSLLLDLVGREGHEPPGEIELMGVRLPAIDFTDVQKNFLFAADVSLELAQLPQQTGESALFDEAIDRALLDLRTSRPRLFPLVTELAVAILLVPPLAAKPDDLRIDLDNLARKIVPRVHSILEPLQGRLLPDPTKFADPKIRAYLEQRVAAARRLPKHHLTRYEVIALPRTANDHPSGSVRLALCDGCGGQTFAEFVRQTIDDWSDATH